MYDLNKLRNHLYCVDSIDENALKVKSSALRKALEDMPRYDDDYFIIDTHKFQILNYSGKYITSTGFDPHFYTGKTIFDFYSRAHNEDLELKIKFFFETAIPYINQMPKKNLKDIIIQTTYRLKNKWNRYVYLIEQLRYLEVNSKGEPTLLLVKISSIDNYLVSKVTGSIKILNSENKFVTLVKKVLSKDNLLDSLSKREYEIVDLLANGKNSKRIAQELNISINTVDTHKRNILKKLNFHSTAELISYALKQLHK